MAAKANNMLWLAEISKIFFSETNETKLPTSTKFLFFTEPKNMIKAVWSSTILRFFVPMAANDHWNVLYKVTVFYANGWPPSQDID